MRDIELISCIRFSLQLLAAEGAMIWGLPGRKNFGLRLAAGLAGYFAFALLIFFGLRSLPETKLAGEIAYYIFLFGATLGLVWFCWEISGKELLFAGVVAYATQHLAFSLTQVLEYLLNLRGYGAAGAVWYYGLWYVLIPIVVYWLGVRRVRREGELLERDRRMVVLACVTLFIAIFVSLLARLCGSEEYFLYLKDFICNLYGVLCSSLSLCLLFYIPKENRLRREQQLLEQVIRVMGEQQQLSRESMDIINRKCHDIKHQLRALMEMEDGGERRKYLEEIRGAMSIYDAVYQTGNAALDTVLREKALLCQEYEIKFSCMADGKALEFMDTLDVYALFGNALDNAVESVMREEDKEKRLINMRITKQMQILYIHLDNYCREPVRFEDGLPVTSKKDRENHGFGLRSIRHIAEKYDGEVVLKNQEERFILDLLLPIPEGM